MQVRNLIDVQLLIVTIAQEGSFSRASKRLGITQPSLTRRVAALESDIGARLFHRTSRTLELTHAGRLYVRESSRALEYADRAWNLAHHQGQLEQGQFRLGYSPYIRSTYLARLFRLSASTGISLQCVPTCEGMKRVLRGELHGALGIQPIEDQDLWVRPVGAEGFALCLSKNHPLARKQEVTVADLKGQHILWIPQSCHPRFYSGVISYLQSVGGSNSFMEVLGQTHALDLVAEGLGLALMPRSAARISRMGVIVKSLSDRYLSIETALYARRDQNVGRTKDVVDRLISTLGAPGISGDSGL
jgi:LysR family transcriptional regulator, benzoate and cis,cis-muconate-responsive activator of ben and cat genes